MNELKNRERRLRYAAHTGYLIVKADTKAVIAGYDCFDNQLLIEQAERFITEY